MFLFMCLDEAGGKRLSTAWVDEIGIDVLVYQSFGNQFSRLASCYKEIVDFEIRAKLSFSYIIRSRPDLVWIDDMPAWKRLRTFF